MKPSSRASTRGRPSRSSRRAAVTKRAGTLRLREVVRDHRVRGCDAAGFADPVLDQETITLRWKSAEALVAELRQFGGNTAPDRHPALRTPAWRERLLAALRERADADGSIGLSVEVAYGHGFKPAPRLRADTPVAVSLDEMKAMVRRPRSSN